MTVSRDPDSAPTLLQIAAGAGLALVGNFFLLIAGIAFIASQVVLPAVLIRQAALGLGYFILFHGLLQWLYVLPLLALQWRSRRGFAIGVLLGAIAYTVVHASMVLGLVWLGSRY